MKLTRVRVKLIVLLATLNIAIAGLVYGLGLWSFDRSFSNYLEQKNLQRLTPVAMALGEAFARKGSWPALLAEPETIAKLLGSGFAPPAQEDPLAEEEPRQNYTLASHPGVFAAPQGMPPPPGLVIQDARGRTVLGPRHAPANLSRIAIDSNRKRVGYLGVMPAPGFAVAAADQAFLEQQQKSFATIALALLLASGLGAAGIAHWLGKPIGALVRAICALAKGESGVRIAVRGKDELGELARRFNTLAETLEASRKARQERLADISHELRAPLTVLLGKIEAIEDGIHPASVAGIHSLHDDVSRLAASIDDLHLLALTDPAPLACRKTRIELDTLIERLISGHQHAIEHAGLTIELALHRKAWVVGDPVRLTQLFGNLLHNSLRYTCAPGRIRVELEAEDSGWKLRWEDSAPGVSNAELAHLIERRYRAASSVKCEQDGSGLGLAIAHSVAQAHGARLEAGHSELGGLLWSLHFPTIDGSPA